jgi:methionine synthase II (cobalamin-independent)
MSTFQGDWLPFAMGSLPYTDVNVAWKSVLQRFPNIPAWPQMPRRSFLENMYVQYSERFPGIRLEGERIYVDRRADFEADLERLYLAYLENDLYYGQISADYAMGLEALRRGDIQWPHPPLVLKGQVTGPVSWGLMIVDQNQRPILYDEVLADAVAKHLSMKAIWQEAELAQLVPRTLMMIDEPYMASFGSAFVALSREQVVGLLNEVMSGLHGLKGVHCCGNTDWSILLGTTVDILSLDAYEYAETLALYPEDVSRFLARGGIIAWGIVPAGYTVESETVESLVIRLHEAMENLIRKGVSQDALLQAGMVTPSCGLGSLTPEVAEHVFQLTAGVSAEMRHRYIPSSGAS